MTEPDEIIISKSDAPWIEEPEVKKDCVLCNTVWGVFGVLIGIAFVFIGADLLTGGFISSLISGKVDDD